MTNKNVMQRFSLGMLGMGGNLKSIPVKGDAGVCFLFSYQQLIAVKVFNDIYLADYTSAGLGSISQTTNTHVNMVKRLERCTVHVLGTKKALEHSGRFEVGFAECLRRAA